MMIRGDENLFDLMERDLLNLKDVRVEEEERPKRTNFVPTRRLAWNIEKIGPWWEEREHRVQEYASRVERGEVLFEEA